MWIAQDISPSIVFSRTIRNSECNEQVGLLVVGSCGIVWLQCRVQFGDLAIELWEEAKCICDNCCILRRIGCGSDRFVGNSIKCAIWVRQASVEEAVVCQYGEAAELEIFS